MTLVGTACTGGSTLVGWLYHVGYLETVGVPAELVEVGFRDLLLNAYMAILSWLACAIPAFQEGATARVMLAAALGVLVMASVVAVARIWQQSAALERARRRAHAALKRPPVWDSPSVPRFLRR